MRPEVHRVRIGAALVCVTLCAAAGEARVTDQDESAGGVLVQTQMPQRGSMPATVLAYGLATPAVNGGMTLSVQAEGRVQHIDVTAGEAVQAGRPLLEFQLSAAASSSYTQAVAAFKLAQEQRARTARLLEHSLATREQLAQADKAVVDAQAALTALQLEHGGEALQTIRAPFNGVVSALRVSQGERVPGGAPLVTVTRQGGLVVTVGVEPSARRDVQVGQPVDLMSLTDGGSAQQGTVARVDRVLNPKTRLVDVDIAPREAGSAELLEGAAYQARIRTDELEGWVVPRDAVLGDGHGDYVFQVAAGKAVRVAVMRLGGDDEHSVVDGSIDPQRPLIIAGNYQLSDGTAVRLHQAPSDASGP
ncbi:MAG TPA: efflux RND transporter periplasmic adaptor subunit [Steroidobacteraceae bacterium]|nr:efflux RND transporter periplasmic adaptor subunit [Steroidobacteraceae bacterium]